MKPTVSIILCTRNRAESLRLTLEAMQRVNVPADLSAEILVVDNGSTDETAAVVKQSQMTQSTVRPDIRTPTPALPLSTWGEGKEAGVPAEDGQALPVRYVREPKAGKGYAYNAGMAAAEGSIFLFSDDDVRPPANWIEEMCRPILEGRASSTSSGQADAVAGGVIFPAEQQAALSRPPYCDHRGWFACTENLDPIHPGWMVGANMAFGRHVLAAVPAFDTNLGPGALGFGDETLFAFQLLDAGYKLIAAPDVAVEHHFDLSRLNRKAMLEIARKMGRSAAYVDWHWHHKDYPLHPLAGLRMWLGLWRRRLTHPMDWIGASAPAEWELDCVRTMAFRRQYKIESKRPRKYSRVPRPARQTSAA